MRTSSQRIACVALLGAAGLAALPQEANAVPVLQMYVEGATYDSGSESWVYSGSGSFKLWVIGNVGGAGSKGTIYDVKLAAAVATNETGTITLTPATTSLLIDPSPSADPVNVGKSVDGAIPLLGDGSSLETHGEYGTGKSFYEWALGDFTLKDSPIADFINAYPTSFDANAGQINAYQVSVSGFSSVHFDAYDHVASENTAGYKYEFAPYSHDAEVPEPGTYALTLAGLGLLGFAARRRKQNKAA